MNVVYTANATATGGRNGHARSDDGIVDVTLSVPKAMGGPGASGATNPEQLFAAGYAACFAGAVDHVARKRKLDPGEISVASHVGIGPREAGGFGLTVALDVTVPGLPRDEAEAVVKAAHEEICPYSHATRNNVDVQIKVV